MGTITNECISKSYFKECSKPAFSNAVGHFIRIPGAENDFTVFAKVIEANKKSNMLTIQYVDSIAMGKIIMDDDYDTVPFGAASLNWLLCTSSELEESRLFKE